MASEFKSGNRAATSSRVLRILANSLAVLITIILCQPAHSQGSTTTTTTETYADGATKSQDTTVTRADGTKSSETRTDYDENGRPTNETQETYDQNGKLKQRHEKTWVYDDKGRLLYFESSDHVYGDTVTPGAEDKYRVRRKYKDENDKEGTITQQQTYTSDTGKWRDFDAEREPEPSMQPLQPLKTEKKSAEQAPPKTQEKPPEKSKSDTSSPLKTTSANTALPENGGNAPGYQVASKTANGLHVTTFDTPQGSVQVNFTDDLYASGTFSGTVVDQPAGQTPQERAINAAVLDQLVVQFAGQQVRPADKYVICKLPAMVTPDSENVVLLQNGKSVASSDIPISPTPPPAETTTIMPTGGQQGQPIAIKGPSDGVFSPEDYVKIGQTVVPILAKSPLKEVALDTSTASGPTTIEAAENGVTTEGPFQNIGVRLQGDTHLMRGQQGPLDLTVFGLLGIRQNVPVDLRNSSTGVVTIIGGNVQHFTVTPWQVGPDGTWNKNLVMTGQTPGVFRITADVHWTNPGSTQESVNVSDQTTQEKFDAALAKRNEKRKAYDAAGAKFDAAYKAAMASADPDKVKAYEQARKASLDAGGASARAYMTYEKNPTDANKQAFEEASKKAGEAGLKENAASGAMWDSMDPAKREALHKAWEEMNKAAGEYLQAQKEFDEAFNNSQR